MKGVIKYVLVIFSLYSCNDTLTKENQKEPLGDANTIAELYWLIGEWKSVSPDGVMYETWTKTNDKLLSGKSFFVSGKDTLFSEKIALQQNGNALYYTPTVSDQNNSEPVPFKFIEFNKGEFIFENKEHDFPQRIIYKNPQPDFLIARIQGIQNGKFHKEDFNFVKIK